jgi:hypothetical protein
MRKIKWILPVFAMILLLGLSNSAFAQLTCAVGSTPIVTDTESGLTEPAGDLNFNCAYGGSFPTTPATITINYGVPITSSSAAASGGVNYPTAKPILVLTNDSGFPLLTCPVAPTVGAINNSTGQVVLNVPAENANCRFALLGVLFAISGNKPAGQSIDANISASSGNGLSISGSSTVTVVNNILAGLKTPTVPSGAGIALTNTSVLSSGFSIAVQENYNDLYRALGQFNPDDVGGPTASNGTQLLFTFSGIPAGVTMGGCSASISPAGAAPTISPASVTALAPAITVSLGSNAQLGTAETITLACTTFVVAGGTLTLPTSNITATVTLAPTGDAFSGLGALLTDTATTGKNPRYASSPVSAGTVFSIVPSTTHMLFPYVSIGGGFDTGFAIANTTADPYGTTGNAGGARPLTGGVTLVFYPTTGAAFCVTTLPGASIAIPTINGIGSCTNLDTITSPSKSGQGLSSGGVVNSGASWVVLGSELLKQVSGAPEVFTGYVFGIANFTNGHPTVFIADAAFSGKFTAGGPALVLANPSSSARFVTTGVETLGH